MPIYVISQIFVLINYIFLITTYQITNNKKILLYNTLACTSSMIAFFLLKAYSGCAMSLIAVIRNFMFMNKTKNKSSLILITLILICFSIYTYDGLFSILPSIATFLYTLSVWQDNNKMYKAFGIPIEICWLSYHIYIKSILGIIFETMLFISVLLGIFKKSTR